jgi:AAA family ATP:ADP antiporter
MTRTFDRLLDLRHGERGRALLLFLYLFLVLSTYVGGKATRDALFLAHYKAGQLPYADIAVALLVGVLISLYIRVRRQLNLLSLLVGSLLFFSSNALFLWWLGQRYDYPWVAVVTYIWVGMFGVIAPAQVWTLANYVLTLREAKRLFGVIGSGAILGWVVGGLMTSTTARRFGAGYTLLAMAAALALCAILVAAIWRRRPATLAEFDETPLRSNHEAPRSLSDSLRLVTASPYLRAIALVIGLSSLVTGVAAWQFKAIAKDWYPNTNDLAWFFGSFNFYAGLLALVTQLLLTSRVLRKFGVGVALFIVPISMTLGSIGLIVFSGALAAVVVLKGSDQILRYSIDKSTVELLFLPVPPAQTFHAKLFIDGIVWRIGDGLASIAILVSVTAIGMTVVGITWINLVLLACWMVAAFFAYRQYVANLTETIHQHRLDAERASAPVLERSMTELIASKLSADDLQDVLYGMGLLEVSQQRTTHPAIRALLRHPSPDVRARAVGILSEARDTTVLPLVEDLLRDPDMRVRTEALLYLTHHAHIDPLARIEQLGDFQDFSIRSAMVAFLAWPGETQNLEAASILLDQMVTERGPDGARTRLESARLLGSLPVHFDTHLRTLLDDPDPEVIRHAIRAVGRQSQRGFLERVIERLGDPAVGKDAADVMAHCGDRVVGTLRDHLVDTEVPIERRREIPEVLLRIGTPAAQHALVENLICSDTILRFRIISALNKLRQTHADYDLDVQMVETGLVAEIMGHYRSYEILGTLGRTANADDPVTRGLRESMNQELERIFRLLQLLFPVQDIHSAYVGLQSRNPLIHDNALELLDNVLRPQLRSLLVPLLDSEVSVEERTELANRILGRGLGGREEAIAALIYSEDPWLKACAAYSIGALGLKSLEHELDRWLNDADPLLRETARHSKAQLA